MHSFFYPSLCQPPCYGLHKDGPHFPVKTFSTKNRNAFKYIKQGFYSVSGLFLTQSIHFACNKYQSGILQKRFFGFFKKINVLLQRGKTMTLMMKGSIINKFTAVWCPGRNIMKTMKELSLIQLNAFLISAFLLKSSGHLYLQCLA